MLAIAVGLVSHSYALTSLFPYVGYMVQNLGVTDDKDEAGQSMLAHSKLLYVSISTEKKQGREGGRRSAEYVRSDDYRLRTLNLYPRSLDAYYVRYRILCLRDNEWRISVRKRRAFCCFIWVVEGVS